MADCVFTRFGVMSTDAMNWTCRDENAIGVSDASVGILIIIT